MASKHPYNELTKLTARFYEPMFADFDRQMTDTFLRRDAFLDRVIATEIPHLRADLQGKRLSNEAHSHISRELKMLGGSKAPPLRQVSLNIRHVTAEALRKVVEDHNLVRDAFLNLLIAFLRSSDTFLDHLDLPKNVGAIRGVVDMPTSPIRAIEDAQTDPLYYLRAGCDERHGCGLYNLPLPREIHAFSCCLPDDEVPESSAWNDKQESDRLIWGINLEPRRSRAAGK